MESALRLAEKPLLEILTLIRSGLPAPMFEQVASALGLSTSTLAAKLGIARRTLTRNEAMAHPLSSETSEKLAAGCAGTQSPAAHCLRPTQRYRNGYRSPSRPWAIWRPSIIGHRLRRP